MATVTNSTPNVICLEYRQEKSDGDYGSCLWSRFYFDCDNYSLFIDSDCGNYWYKWCVTPAETFMHLMARCKGDYILYNISSKSVIDSKATYNNFIEYLYAGIDGEMDEIPDEEITEGISAACDYGTEREVVDSVCDVISEKFGMVDTYELVLCVEKDYPAGAKKIAEIFQKHIRPFIRENGLS